MRFLLGQLVLHVLKSDSGLKAWSQQVRKRRGSKIARVGVMRKLAASIWHMVKYDDDESLTTVAEAVQLDSKVNSEIGMLALLRDARMAQKICCCRSS